MFTKPLKQLVRAQQKSRRTRRLHAHINAKPSLLSGDGDAGPGPALSPAQRKRIQEYSKDVFGSRRFAPWLELYSAYRGEFIEGWIPENYYMRVLLPTWDRHKTSMPRPSRAGSFEPTWFRTWPIPSMAFGWIATTARSATSKLKDYLFAKRKRCSSRPTGARARKRCGKSPRRI